MEEEDESVLVKRSTKTMGSFRQAKVVFEAA